MLVRGVQKRSLPLLAVSALVTLVIFLAVTGIPVVSAIVIGAVVAAQVWAGGYVWRLVTPHAPGTGVEFIGMGVALGSLGAVVFGALLLPLMPASVGGCAPIVAVAVLAVVRRIRGKRLDPCSGLDRPTVVALSIGVVLGLGALIINLRNYPLAWIGTRDSFHPDMVFFEALSRSVSSFGSGDSVFMVSGHVRYHWLAYGWAGQLTETAGLAPFASLTRVLPFVALVGASALAAGWARRLSSVRWVPLLAVLLVVVGGYVGAVYGTLLNVDSPSQALTTVWLLALSLSMWLVISRGLPATSLVLVALLAAGCTGGKISASLVALGGAVLMAAVGVLRREEWARRAVQSAGAVVAGSGAAYVVLLLGSASSGDLQVLTLANRASSVQGLNVGASAWGVVLGTAVLLLAVVPRWSGLAILIVRPESRWRPETWLGAGAAGIAVIALAALSHGVNDLWFCLSASTPLAVLSAVGLGEGVRDLGTRRRRAAGAAVAGAVLFALVVLVWRTGAPSTTSLRWAAPVLAVAGACLIGWIAARGPGRGRWDTLILTCVVLVSAACFGRLIGFVSFGSGPPQAVSGTATGTGTAGPAAPELAGYIAWGDEERAAAAAIVAAGSADDVVATEQIDSSLIPALTARRTFLTGALYQEFIGTRADAATLDQRAPVARDISQGPAADVVGALCGAGVDWIWTTPEAASRWSSLAVPLFEGTRIVVLRLAPGTCD